MTPEQQAAIERAMGQIRGNPQADAAARALERVNRGQSFPRRQEGETTRDYYNRLAAEGREPSRGSAQMQVAAEDAAQTANDQAILDHWGWVAKANELQRGIPFVVSYIDEAYGVISPRAQQDAREMSEAMRRQKPGQTLALNLAGGVLGSVPAAVAAGPALVANAGKTIGARALQGAGLGSLLGATEGAVYGYGEGQTPEERRGEALQQGAVGGALGGILGAAAPYAAAGLKNVISRFRTSDVETIARELNVSDDAARVIRNALDSGDDEAAIAAIRRGGADAMLADASPSTQSILDTAAQMPGDSGRIAREAVEGRVSQATQRMTSALDDTLGLPRGAQEVSDEIRRSSAGVRSAAYDAAYAVPVDYSSAQGRRIEALLNRVPDSAIRRANQLMQANGEESAQIMARIADNGTVTFERMPDVRQLDYITRALNDIADVTDGQGKLGGQTALGSAYQNVSRGIRAAMREAVPEYGVALDTAADAISQRNALQMGGDLLSARVSREDVARALQGASQAERAAMAQGLRTRIDDTTARITRTITDNNTEAREGIRILRDLSSRDSRDKLRILLGTEATDRLLAEVDEAATAFELRAAIAQNSRTAVRQATQQSVRDQVDGGIVRTLASGEPVNASKRIVQALTGETAEARALREMGLYEEISNALVNTRGMRAERALLLINRAMQGQALSDSQARFVATALTTSLAGGSAPTASRETSRLLSNR